jgi:isopenicillin-N N-acyltransferase like protein
VTVTDVVTPPASFPSLRSEGPPREVGRAHGRAFGDQIAGSISLYRRKFDDIGLDWNRALDLAHRSGDFLRGLDHELAEEMEGIAEGAHVDPLEILTINIRTGLIRMMEVETVEDHECTTAAVCPPATADGHTLVGQNWDQSGECQANTVVIEQHIPGQPALLFVTEAGILFRHGMNDAGVGIAGNALRTDKEGRADRGAPSPVPRRRALRHTNLEDAHQALIGTPRSHSGNHLLAADGGGAVDVEAVPGRTFSLRPDDAILVHANHFTHPQACELVEDRSKPGPETLQRDCRVRDVLRGRLGKIGVEDVKAALQDHERFPDSVCRHPGTSPEMGFTLVSTVMDLTARTMWTAPGPGCLGTYTEYGFS